MTRPNIFEGDLGDGFRCRVALLHAVRASGGGWDVFRTDEQGATSEDRVAWFENVAETLRYLKAVDDGYRTAFAAGDIIRWGLAENDEQRDEDETFAEPCDRCGTPIPSNCDRSPNYCGPCAVIVNAQGGDED